MDDGIKTFRIRRGHELEDVYKLFIIFKII
jgi:hypothetical protein